MFPSGDKGLKNLPSDLCKNNRFSKQFQPKMA